VLGGQPGAPGAVRINGRQVDIKDSPFTLAPGDCIGISTPGGGGFGEASDLLPATLSSRTSHGPAQR
jgi:N-methylhydantoinase B/oxoprolinase/acetone carboxylase alpha subunit